MKAFGLDNIITKLLKKVTSSTTMELHFADRT